MLLLLALAADERGASFYGRSRMAERLGLSRREVDVGLERLREAGLVAWRPWRAGSRDGVWQLVELPPPRQNDQGERGGEALSVGAILAQLGWPNQKRGPSSDSRVS